MDRAAQQQQIDGNYDAFQRTLSSLIGQHRDEFALMRDRSIVEFHRTAGDAYRDGLSRFSDGIFSIQEVTDQPVDLGFHSVVRGN